MHSSRNCKAPTCSYSETKRKCVKPNPYFEALAWCKRNGIHNTKCKKEYFADKKKARSEACNRYEEKIHYVKPAKKCPEGKVINPKTGRCIKIKVEKEKRVYRRKKATQNLAVVKRSSSISRTPRPNISSMKRLSNFSSVKGMSSSSKSSQYSKVFKKQHKEKKNAKFIKKGKTAFQPRSTSNPLRKKVAKDTLGNIHLKKIKRHPFIKDVYDGNMKGILEEQQDAEIKRSHHKSASSTSRKVKEMLQKIKATKIQKFLKKNLIKKYFTLEKRVNYYKYVRSFLKDLDQKACLQTKEYKDKNNKIINGYTVNDIIDLEKQIGSKSEYGVIYRTSVKNMLGKAPIATKLMPINTENRFEINLNMNISKEIIKPMISRHFLLTYKAFECENRAFQVPKIIMNTRYYITLNELAHGDLQSICGNKDYLSNNELMLNLAAQAMISIATFHHLGYIHKDCHWGNFLYHMTEDISGYYHYKINKKDYYLKNSGFTLMIYDFGFAIKYNSKTADLKTLVASDYNRVLRAFKNKTGRGWNKHTKLPTPLVSEYIHSLQTAITTRSVVYEPSFTYKDIMYKTIINKLLAMPINNIFVETLPAGEKIINHSAFVIDDSLYGRI